MRLRVNIVGAGPAGLMFALLLKRRFPRCDVLVVERNPADATFGFGLVFSERALEFLRIGDAETFAILAAAMESWPDQQIVHRDEAVRIDGSDFNGIGRLVLLQRLQEQCRAVGVRMQFSREVDSMAGLADCDLLVGADGINSFVRQSFEAAFGTDIRFLTNRFVWYGTHQPFDCLTLTFRENRHGAFVAHHYRYAPDMSTFIVECDAATWSASGLESMNDAASRAYCEGLFAPDLGGHPLISNNSLWRRFPVVTNRNWHHENIVLIGDALRSVHFSIGSGTRLALEDSIALFQAFETCGADVAAALREFEARRRPVVETLLAAAANSFDWYEEFAGKMHMDAWQLAYDYVTRSGRMSHERLRSMAPRFLAGFEARHGGGSA